MAKNQGEAFGHLRLKPEEFAIALENVKAFAQSSNDYERTCHSVK
jgi:hypothetical protein